MKVEHFWRYLNGFSHFQYLFHPLDSLYSRDLTELTLVSLECDLCLYATVDSDQLWAHRETLHPDGPLLQLEEEDDENAPNFAVPCDLCDSEIDCVSKVRKHYLEVREASSIDK